jgi:hypothetical protein
MDEKASEEYKECPRCNCFKLPDEFINSRGVSSKTCSKCLEKKRKYFSQYKCEKHGKGKLNCPGCKIEKEAKEGKVFKPMKTKTKEIKVDENGEVTVIYTNK